MDKDGITQVELREELHLGRERSESICSVKAGVGRERKSALEGEEGTLQRALMFTNKLSEVWGKRKMGIYLFIGIETQNRDLALPRQVLHH